MRNTRYNASLMVALCLYMQGCAPELPFQAPEKSDIVLPQQFPEHGGEATVTPDEPDVAALPNTGEVKWSDFFSDPHLSGLIETALHNNQELHILEQESFIAQNEIMARKGEYLPRLGIGAGYELEKVGEHTSRGATEAGTEFLPVDTVPEHLHNRSVGLSSSWEVDIWKRLRNAAKSASFKYRSTVEARKFMITQLVAEIAGTYYELLALDRELEIVQQYMHTLKQAQEVVELQKSAARSNELAVKRFEAEVQKNQSRQYTLQRQVILTENRLNTLVGRLPQPIERSATPLADLLPGNIQAGVPSALLDNRPDVKQALLELEAAKLDVKAARARFYPALNIEAGTGYEAFNSSHFLNTPESLFYHAAAGLTAPLLNRAAIKADYFSSNNKQIQAVYHYERTLINAYTEVSNQLVTIDNLENVRRSKSQQVDALAQSVDIANMLFKAARVDYLESLLAQRDFLEAQMELVEIRQQQLASYVNLYKALGGGWRDL